VNWKNLVALISIIFKKDIFSSLERIITDILLKFWMRMVYVSNLIEKININVLMVYYLYNYDVW